MRREIVQTFDQLQNGVYTLRTFFGERRENSVDPYHISPVKHHDQKIKIMRRGDLVLIDYIEQQIDEGNGEEKVVDMIDGNDFYNRIGWNAFANGKFSKWQILTK